MQARSELIHEFDRIVAATDPRKPLIAGKESLSYGTLVERVRRLTSWFRALGVRAGDRLVIISDSGSATFTFFMAALRNGAAAAVIDPAAAAEEVKTLITAADPVLLCMDRSLYEAAGLRAALPDSIKVIQIEPDQRETGGLTRRLAGLFGSSKAEAPKENYPGALSH